MNFVAWTDVLLAAEAFALAALLLSSDPARRAWAGALAALGISALAGALVAFDLPALPALALVRDLSVAAVTTLGLLAHALHFRARPRLLLYTAAVYALAFALAVVLIGGFLVVVALYAPVMLALGAWHLARLRDRGSASLAGGIAVCFVAAGVLVGKLAIGPLPPGAVYHLVMMAAVALLFVGGRSLSRHPGAV